MLKNTMTKRNDVISAQEDKGERINPFSPKEFMIGNGSNRELNMIGAT